MDSNQESSGDMPVETRSAKRRRDDSGDEVEGEGVAQELLPVNEKKAYRAALHKKWREALARDHIGIRPGTEKLKSLSELPPEVAQGVVIDLHTEFHMISKDVISSNLATYHANLLRRNNGAVRIQMGTSPIHIDAEVILGIRAPYDAEEHERAHGEANEGGASPSPSVGAPSHGQNPEPQSPAPQERGKGTRQPVSGKTPLLTPARGTPTPGAPPRRQQQRKRTRGESASRGRGSAIETIEESEPSQVDGDNAIAPASRGPSVQRSLFGDAGPAKANLDSAFAVLDSILTELGKADESVHLEAERAKREAEAKFKAAEAMKEREAKILEDEQRVADEIARLTADLAQATDHQKRLLDRAKEAQRATLKALQEAEAAAEVARAKEVEIVRSKEQQDEAKRRLKQVIDRL